MKFEKKCTKESFETHLIYVKKALDVKGMGRGKNIISRISSPVMGKKGFYFSLLSLLLVMIMVLIFGYNNQVTGLDAIESVKIRVTVLDAYVKALEHSYIPAELERATRDALNEIANERNGGSTVDDNLLTETGFKDQYRSRIISKFNKNSFSNLADTTHKTDTSITVKSVELSQNDPWFIEVKANVQLQVIDKLKVANWKNDNLNIVTNVSIAGMQDPLYKAARKERKIKYIADNIKFRSESFNRIKTSDIQWFGIPKTEPLTNMITLIQNNIYMNWSGVYQDGNAPTKVFVEKPAPCYLHRFLKKSEWIDKNDEKEKCGIMSFIDVNDYDHTTGTLSPMGDKPIKLSGKTHDVKEFRDYKFFHDEVLPFEDLTTNNDALHKLFYVSGITSLCENINTLQQLTGIYEELNKPCGVGATFISQNYDFKLSEFDIQNVFNLDAHACKSGSRFTACKVENIVIP